MAGKYTAESTIATALSTELNSLANAGISSASPALSNDGTGERDFFGNFEIYIAAQGTNRSAGASISLYVIPEVDDTNYGSSVGECLDNYFAGSVAVDDAALAARYIILEGVKLPPSDFKVVLKNDTGQAFAASGNTVKFKRHGYEDV